ncbi:hypothetical protein ABKN59_009289 [Abortiporus biennis]
MVYLAQHDYRTLKITRSVECFDAARLWQGMAWWMILQRQHSGTVYGSLLSPIVTSVNLVDLVSNPV